MDAYERALKKCHPQLRNMNADGIIPHLNSKGLLATNEFNKLQTMATDYNKNDEILRILPTKGKGWWDKFLECLSETADDNPQHDDLIKDLKGALKEQQKGM